MDDEIKTRLKVIGFSGIAKGCVDFLLRRAENLSTGSSSFHPQLTHYLLSLVLLLNNLLLPPSGALTANKG